MILVSYAKKIFIMYIYVEFWYYGLSCITFIELDFYMSWKIRNFSPENPPNQNRCYWSPPTSLFSGLLSDILERNSWIIASFSAQCILYTMYRYRIGYEYICIYTNNIYHYYNHHLSYYKDIVFRKKNCGFRVQNQ